MQRRSFTSKAGGTFILFLFFVVALLPSQTLAAPLGQETGSPLVDQTWVRLGGPPGGIGYDIKVNPENLDIWYVTDAFAGIHKSVDGGQTWANSNQGIDVHFGPSGDSVPVFCVTIDPNNPNIIWIGLQNERGIYRSEDGGLTWEKRVNGIIEGEGLTVRGITVQEGNSDIVYAGAEISSWSWAGKGITGRQFDMVKGVVYKSKDGGQTWTAIWRGNNMARYVIIDPNDANILYVSTGIFDREAANSNYQKNDPGGEGILKSYDGGKTWVQINNGLNNLYVGSLVMNSQSSNVLLAGVGTLSYTSGSGVYITQDGGNSWKMIYASDTPLESVDFAPNDPNIIYAASEIAFLSSTDGGKHWKEYRNRSLGYGWGPAGVNPGQPIDIQVDPRDPLRVFVNNYAGGNVLSEDGGATWVNASNGYTGENVTSLAIDPLNVAVIYTNGKSGYFKSIDGGKSWEGILPMELMGGAYLGEVSIIPTDPETLLASNIEATMYASQDGGKAWSNRFNYGPSLWTKYSERPRYAFQGVHSLAVSPSAKNIVYAGFSFNECTGNYTIEFCSTNTDYTLLKSIDSGKTWSAINSSDITGFNIASIVVHPANPDIAWIAVPLRGIYKTVNGGVNWEAGSSLSTVFSLTVDPSNPDVLYAGTRGNGVYRSKDGGKSWKQSAAGMESNDNITSIVVDPVRPNIIYASSRQSGVYMSEDQGGTWRLLNNGLSMRSVNLLELSRDGNTLYAGTMGEGVFRLSTHDQAYFDSLVPTPTAIPPTVAPTIAVTETPVATPTQMPTPAAPAVKQESSPIMLYIGAVILFILGFIVVTQRKRRSGK